MGKFINPFTDEGFKRIFGQEISKPILLTFLNTLLEGEYHIVDLKYLDKEQLGIADEDRSLIYDIYCEVDGGGILLWRCKTRASHTSRIAAYIIFLALLPCKVSVALNGNTM